MPELACCRRCQLYARSSSLVCAVHPCGPSGYHCLDFRPHNSPAALVLSEQAPDAWSLYAGELLHYAPHLTAAQQLALLTTHPFFTGHCPRCGYKYREQPEVYWDCPECGWIDDAVH